MGLSCTRGAFLKFLFTVSLCTGECNGVALAIFLALVGAFLEYQEGARVPIGPIGRVQAMRILCSGKHCLEWVAGG